MNIRIIKLVTGEEIVCEYRGCDRSSTTKIIKSPFLLFAQPDGNLGMMPFMPFVKGDIKLRESDIMLCEEADDKIVAFYTQQTTSIETVTAPPIIT